MLTRGSSVYSTVSSGSSGISLQVSSVLVKNYNPHGMFLSRLAALMQWSRLGRRTFVRRHESACESVYTEQEQESNRGHEERIAAKYSRISFQIIISLFLILQPMNIVVSSS